MSELTDEGNSPTAGDRAAADGADAAPDSERAELRIEGLHAGYGAVTVLRDVSLEVRKGEIVAVLGTNGAGKSTLLNSVAGLLSPTQGSITVGGEELAGEPAEEVSRRGVVLVPEGRQLFAEMTVLENLQLGSYIHRRDSAKRAQSLERVLELFPALKPRLGQAASELSGGQGQMLAIGRGLMANPNVLLLDEPSLGLAPIITREIFETFEQLRGEGVTVLIVEQQAMLTLQLADRGYVLERGEVTASGPAEHLAKDDRVRSAYLGLAVDGGDRTDARAGE